MDAKLKADWVKALRSGDFKQGQRALRRGETFCCLGVLCDVMGAEWGGGDDVDLNPRINGELQAYYLAPVALETTGMTFAQQERLYDMNDEGKPFSEIADYIEANL